MKLSYKNSKRIWLVLAILYFTAGYLLINWFNYNRSHYFDVGFKFENDLPLIPVFIFGYLLVYLSVLGIYFLCDEEKIFMKAIKLFFTLTTVHYLLFILIPVKMQLRPETIQPTGFINHFVRFYYWLDAPYNCFPSLHVAYSFMGTLILWNYKRRWAYVYLVSSLVVSVSVVLIKQHYIVDVIGGYITTLLLYWLITLKRST